jgi:hypothetical protein
MNFVSVNGAGTLASESVVIQNNSEVAIMLIGWTLKDSQGSTYTFPELTLYPGGTIHVFSRAGIDTASDLYWDSSVAVWESGELAALYDTQKIARAFYRVP